MKSNRIERWFGASPQPLLTRQLNRKAILFAKPEEEK
jgi:hypothetical protein